MSSFSRGRSYDLDEPASVKQKNYIQRLFSRIWDQLTQEEKDFIELEGVSVWISGMSKRQARRYINMGLSVNDEATDIDYGHYPEMDP